MPLFKAILLFHAVISSGAFAAPLTAQEKRYDFEQLRSVLNSSYGPLKYKAEMQGIPISALQERYLGLIAETATNRDFYYTLVRFFAELQDSHSNLSVPTTHASILGFTTDWVENKLVIDSVHRAYLPKPIFPFDRGDEIVSLDGRKSGAVLEELESYVGMGFAGTRRRYAAMAFASRSGTRFPVPTGPAMIEIRPLGQSGAKKVALNWIELGEPLDEAMVRRAVRPTWESTEFSVSVRESFEELFPFQRESSYACSGTTRIKIPSDATIVMEKPFVAYYHPTPKGNVGYLRIPHYLSASLEPVPVSTLAAYFKVIPILEKETVGLIIDQDHNCGGEVSMVETMTRFFVSRPFERLQFRLRASKSEYLKYKGIDFLAGLLLKAWQSGEFLTTRTSLTGVGLAQPFSGGMVYSKPVVILIDEMSGSGGDAFPAMMQGFGRAKLLGTRTMGAGGHVEEFKLTNTFSGVSIRLTRSLFFRPDGTAVENNGATPDVAYAITMKDYLDGYLDYQKFYLKTLLDGIPTPN